MRDWPHGVTGTRNEDLLAALEFVERERDMRADERHAFREGFIAGWQERGINDAPEVAALRLKSTELKALHHSYGVLETELWELRQDLRSALANGSYRDGEPVTLSARDAAVLCGKV